MIMLLAKPITTITAWLTLEVGAVTAFIFSMFAQVNPNPLGFGRDSSMIIAYGSLLTAIFGGVVAVIQVVTTARNSKIAHELEIVRLKAEHKDSERQREIEIIKAQNEAQKEEILRNNAWIQTIKRKHPEDSFDMDPTHGPEPKIVEKLATPVYPANMGVSSEEVGTGLASSVAPEKLQREAEAVLLKADATREAAASLLEGTKPQA